MRPNGGETLILFYVHSTRLILHSSEGFRSDDARNEDKIRQRDPITIYLHISNLSSTIFLVTSSIDQPPHLSQKLFFTLPKKFYLSLDFDLYSV